MRPKTGDKKFNNEALRIIKTSVDELPDEPWSLATPDQISNIALAELLEDPDPI